MPAANYEQLFKELVRLYGRTHGIERDQDLPPDIIHYGRPAVAQFLGERIPEHILVGDELLLVILDSKAHRLRFSADDELEVEYLGPLVGGDYREWVKEGSVRFQFNHRKLQKALELDGRTERYEELRNLLRDWAETPLKGESPP
jgi:hypothetical protein